MEAKIYKEVLLGNYNKKPQKKYLEHLEFVYTKMKTSKDIFTDGDMSFIGMQIKIISNLHYYVANAMAFNVKNVMNIISPSDPNKTRNEILCSVYSPNKIVWLEDYTRLIEGDTDCKFFTLFIRMEDRSERRADMLIGVCGSKTTGDGICFGHISFGCFIINNVVDHMNGQIKIATPFLFSNNPSINPQSIANDNATDIACYARFCHFLNIKNIHAKKNVFGGLTARQKRINRIQGGLRYYTLVVSKPGKQYDATDNGEYAGTMPLHMCRGHVRRYTDDRPLFGKYSGTFYIPAHVKGKMENGIIAKDYELKAI